MQSTTKQPPTHNRAFLIVIACMLLSSGNLLAQNLVPNGNFESFSACPTSHSQLDGYVNNWFNPAGASPDYENACNSGSAGVPNNIFGNQAAHSGDAYCHIILFSTPTTNADFREYISVHLLSPLIKDSTYHFRMYGSLSDIHKYGSDMIGVYFSNTLVLRTTGSQNPLNLTPQLENTPGNLFDYDNWTVFEGDYVAAGGEQYIVIGNFYWDSQVDYSHYDASRTWNFAGLYIDDVSLEKVTTITPCSTFGATASTSNCQTWPGDSTITVSATGGLAPYTYSLDNISFQPDSLFTGVDPGSYTIYVNDSSGCQATAQVVLSNFGTTIANVASTNASCGNNNGAILVSAIGGDGGPYSYSIDGGSNFQADSSFTGLPGGTYDIVVEDGAACQATTQVVLTATTAPAITNIAATDPSCGVNDATIIITASGGIAPLRYSINNGSTFQASNSFANLSAGTYNLAIEDSAGCQDNTQVTINASTATPVTLTSSDPDNSICTGESVTFTATPAGLVSYNFLNGSTILQQSASNIYTTSGLASGNSITVVADNGVCPDTSAAIVTVVNAFPTATLASSDPDNTICAGESITFTATPAGLTQYDFYENGNLMQSSASDTYTSVTPANGTSVTVSASNNGCIGPLSPAIVITVNPYPVVTLSSSDPDNKVCELEAVTFTASPAGLNQYDFYNNGVLLQSGSSNSYTFASLTNGNSVSVTAYMNGCADSSNSISTQIIATPVADAGTDMSECIDASAVTLTGTPGGGIWSGGVVSTAGSFDPATAGAGTHSLIYTVSEPVAGCTDTDTMQFVVHALPLADAGADVSICETESTQLSASGGSSYSWSPTADLSDAGIADPVASPLTTTSYTVLVTDANGCESTDSVLVSVQVLPTAVMSGYDVCAGLPVTFTNTSSASSTYTWEFGDGQTSTEQVPTIVYSTGGTYNVVLTATEGNCSDTAVQQVTIFDNPVASFTVDPTEVIAGLDTVGFNADTAGIASWLWDIGVDENFTDPNFTYVYADSGFYTIGLIVTNTEGCQDTLLLPEYVHVKIPGNVYIPNAFTPNGDGINDEFMVFGAGISNFHLLVFNRWGEKVFESHDQSQGWNGTYKGKVLNPNVYVYRVTFTLPDNILQKKEGSITLLR